MTNKVVLAKERPFLLKNNAKLFGEAFGKIDFYNKVIKNAKCIESSFYKSKFNKTHLIKCDLRESNFEDANLNNSYIENSNLSGCDFRGTDLRGKFHNVDFSFSVYSNKTKFPKSFNPIEEGMVLDE